MEKSSCRKALLLVTPALALTLACAASDGRRVTRTTPEGGPAVAIPSGSTGSAPVTTAPEAPPPPDSHANTASDSVESIIDRAQEEYDQGVESLRSGDNEEARDHFDAAVQIFMHSSIPLDQSRRLKHAFDKMVSDIAELESDLDETQGPAPDAVPSPTEELKNITTDLTPDEARKELEKVGPEAKEVSFDIPMVLNNRVLAWIEVIRDRKVLRDSFIGGYQRYGWYEGMIHGILKEEGLPSDLIYLAFLESTFKTNAYSRARAKGIWQFMAPTARECGLKINRFVDERSQPEKSTRAAARYLKDLYELLGDWHLAMAAYDTGAGNILRAQRRSGKTNYWDLAKTRYMHTEAKNYVPALLAMALIAKDPVKYGFEGLEHNAPLEYDRVTVAGPTDLSLVARLADCSIDDLRFLNPHLRLGVTPPGEKDYEVLVPAGKGGTFMAAYEALPDAERIARLAKVHTVRRGETLSTIAARYGTTVDDLKAANNIRNARSIGVGTEINVPNITGAAGWDVERPTRSRRSGRASQTGTKYSPYHVVRRGETLFSISRSYGVSLKNLMEWNGMTEKSVIMPGTRLVVGRGASSSGAVRPAGTTTPETATPAAGLVSVPGGGQAPPDPAGEKILYKVRRGDNLFRISLKYHVTVESLKAWNNITGEGIRVGDVLSIYPN